MSTHIQDALWLVVCAGFVLLMQAGFCCLEGGLVRKKKHPQRSHQEFFGFLSFLPSVLDVRVCAHVRRNR